MAICLDHIPTDPRGPSFQVPTSTGYVRVRRRISDHDLSDKQLIQRLKHEANGRSVDYGVFVLRRNLKPGELSAPDFYRIYRDVRPNAYAWDETIPFRATHRCLLTGLRFQITPETGKGIAHIVTENGSTGSEPMPGGVLHNRFEPV